jgi:hypothetical protein
VLADSRAREEVEEDGVKVPEFLKHASAYAGQGWKVIPLHGSDGGRCTCGKPDCPSPAKHPRTQHGLKDADDRAEIIKYWWEQWPSANIGITTGKASGLVVIDVDGDDGEDSLKLLQKKFDDLPETVEVLTGKGRHLYFKHPGDARIKNATRIAGGLDIRADGGYVVAPPSVHITGRTYEWEVEHHPDDTLLAVLPDWVVEFIGADRPRPASSADGTHTRFIKGGRNDALTSIAGSIRRRGASTEAVFAALKQINHEQCEPPLIEAEVFRIANSVGNYEPSAPIEARTLALATWHESYPEATKWLIDKILPEESCIVIAAEMKTGKTWLTLEMALALASGGSVLQEWQSKRDEGRVLIYSPEGSAKALKRRIWAMCWGRGMDPQKHGANVQIITEPLHLDDDDCLIRVKNTVDHFGADLLIMDPLIALHSGMDENSTEIHTLLQRIREVVLRRPEMSVVLCHHLNKSHQSHSPLHGLRGSTAISAWLDGNLSLSKESDDFQSPRRVDVIMRESESPNPVGFQIIGDPAPAPAPGETIPEGLFQVRLVPCEPFDKGNSAKANKKNKGMDQFLSVVRENEGRYTTKTISALLKISVTTGRRYRSDLEDQGLIESREGFKLWPVA